MPIDIASSRHEAEVRKTSDANALFESMGAADRRHVDLRLTPQKYTPSAMDRSEYRLPGISGISVYSGLHTRP